MNNTEKLQYRSNQTSNLWTVDGSNPAKIKLSSREGETNWLDLTREEYEAIKKILIKQ